MDPVEINAGRYYLRALRADDLIDDRPVLVAAFADGESRRFLAHVDMADAERAGEYVAQRALDWAAGTRLSWAVAEPTTGDLLGEVLLKEVDLAAGTAEAGCWTHPAARGRGLATECLGAVLRFGFGALGLREIRYQHDPDNSASRRVAAKLGFTLRSESATNSEHILRNVSPYTDVE